MVKTLLTLALPTPYPLARRVNISPMALVTYCSHKEIIIMLLSKYSSTQRVMVKTISAGMICNDTVMPRHIIGNLHVICTPIQL